ncbi:hypothetical protein [Leifsonia xyli]
MSPNADVEHERMTTGRDAVDGALWAGPIRGGEGLDAIILGYD